MNSTPESSHPALELAHGELPDHQHAGLAVVEAGDGGEILAAVALEHMRVLDPALFERLDAIGGKALRQHDEIVHALLGQRLYRLDRIRLEPARAAEARLER